ncbi:MAG TPA: AMP-binding protein [Gammaproteobacteria bacterium]|nr:AMP-binding protein [Gammaproteobacteria bacterium]
MDKIWLKNYPDGVPAEIKLDLYESLSDVLAEACNKFHDRPAFANLGKQMTYAELDRKSRDFASFLVNVAELNKGDRVAVMMPNLLQYPVAVFGILRAGLVVVNINPMYTGRELMEELQDAGATSIVILENFAHTLESVLGQTAVTHIITTQVGDLLGFPKSLAVNAALKYIKKMVPEWHLPRPVSFPRALADGARRSFREAPLTRDDLAFLQYTGGTTGRAKGAMLTHGNMIANLEQASMWVHELLEEGQETVITALPLYHIFSLLANCLMFVKLGGLSVLITDPRDMPGFVKELGKWRFTAITGVNTLFNGLLHTPGFEDLDFLPLKLSLGGGAAVQRAVAECWQKTTDTPLIEAYGLTEASPAVCINRPDLAAYNGSVGLPIPSTEVSIRDDDGNEVPLGETGELTVRGPQVMRGYWRNPEETAIVLSEDGWLRTGDMATIDAEGYVRLVDRKKDMILVSGFNVYPNEIEDVVAAMPGVREVAAIGAPDEHSGEVVKLVIVKRDPGLTVDQVKAYCRDKLTGYKHPKYVEFRDELPKSNVGKILRRALREDEDKKNAA